MKLWIHKYGWVAKKAEEKIRRLQPQQITSIAVIKHGALGDMVLTRPFLITLKEYFPNARITLSVVTHYMAEIPEDLIDNLHISFGKHERDKPLKQVIQNYQSLGHHDLIFDITSNARSLWTVFFNSAVLKIGFVPKGGHKYFYKFLYDAAVPRTNYKFEAETFLDQLFTLGLDPAWPLRFDLPKKEPLIEGKYIVYFPGASDSYKCWPADHFAHLIRKMIETYDEYQHIILSGLQEWEQDLANRVVQAVPESKKLRLCQGGEKTFDIISHALLLISNDTGIRNYAIAGGVPTVGIFFSTMPFNYNPRFGLHRTVFEMDGKIPGVERVYYCATEILNKLSLEPTIARAH